MSKYFGKVNHMFYVSIFVLFLHHSTAFVYAINRDGTVKASSANLTAFNTPYAFYDYERDPRQWLTQGYSGYTGSSMTPFSGGVEAIAIGFLIALGIGAIGLPLMILLYSMFIGNNNSGFNFVPPATTTTVSGRKRRDVVSEAMFPNVNPQIQGKLFEIYKQFTDSTEKMDILKRLFKS
ncbi:uncharacterized protein LOC141858718 [Brevipalpus obovatus]|uniref:uncharacterized protein LOC141858718 n=1 Tax=Brevipalpus obovatus TaxID=246614 RepID=UPI003D9EBC5D